MSDPTAKDLKYLMWAVTGAELFSTCGKGKYMAIIVDVHGHVVGIGYNGGPKGWLHCEDGGCPRLTQGSPSGSSYDNCIAIHAEANALLHADYTQYRGGGTIYVNGLSCFGCAKLIANSGLSKVGYVEGRIQADADQVLDYWETCGIDVVSVSRSLVAA